MHDLPVGILYWIDSYVQKRIQAADIVGHDQFYKSVKKLYMHGVYCHSF